MAGPPPPFATRRPRRRIAAVILVLCAAGAAWWLSPRSGGLARPDHEPGVLPGREPVCERLDGR